MEDVENNQNVRPKKEIEFYFWIHAVFRRYVEVTMELILMGLVLVAFILIMKTIYFMGISLYSETNIAHVISEIMLIFILAETVRLLIIYLESQGSPRYNGSNSDRVRYQGNHIERVSAC